MTGKITVACITCGASVTRYPSLINRAPNVFCSRKCSARHSADTGSCVNNATKTGSNFPCVVCGKMVYRQPSRVASLKEGKVFCSHECHRTHDRGGSVNGDGYRMVSVAPYTPVREHRWIAEQHIGRKLLPTEHVHHINGDKLDNRVENLRVLTDSEHMSLHRSKDISRNLLIPLLAKGLTTGQIGNELGVSRTTVVRRLREFGLSAGRTNRL